MQSRPARVARRMSRWALISKGASIENSGGVGVWDPPEVCEPLVMDDSVGSMATGDGVALSTQVLRQIALHDNRCVKRHRIQVLKQFRK